MSTKPRFTVTVHDGDKVVQLVAAESLRYRTNPNGDFVLVVPKPQGVPKPVVPVVPEPTIGSDWVAVEKSAENRGGVNAVYRVVNTGADTVSYRVVGGDFQKPYTDGIHAAPRCSWYLNFRPAPEVTVPFLSRWRHFINGHYIVVVVGSSTGPDQVYYKQESGNGTLIGEAVKTTSTGFTALFRRLPDTKPQQWPQVGSEWHSVLMKQPYQVMAVDREADTIGVCRRGEPGLVGFVTSAQFEERFRACAEAPTTEPGRPIPGSKWTYPDGSGALRVVEKPGGSQREGLVWYRGLADADRLACGMTLTNFLKNFVPESVDPATIVPYSDWVNAVNGQKVRVVGVVGDTITYCRLDELEPALGGSPFIAPRHSASLTEWRARFRRA